MDALTALSPLDGRYAAKVSGLKEAFSEYALIKHRLLVEVEWLLALSEWEAIAELRPFTPAEQRRLRALVSGFDVQAAQAVKAIEAETRHDVKAVEYYLKAQLAESGLSAQVEFVHFACTSEDINNLAYALMLKRGLTEVWLPAARQLQAALRERVEQYRATPMLARTHGQAASPTTLGKELAVFAHRWGRQLAQIEGQEYLGKINGAVGNFNAHAVAYPQADWPGFAKNFVESRLGLTFNPLTTQIEPHDYMAELCHKLIRFNTIGLDLARDMWLYISKGYLKEAAVAGEVGSSTMPHKINPIDFENAEGNFGLANALLAFMAQKLPVSRWQRDLSDSTVLRNWGVATGHSLLAAQSLQKGLSKISVNKALLQAELDASWAVLAEAVQTVMRQAGINRPYEQLKTFTRGKAITQAQLAAFIKSLPLPPADKARLLALSPQHYTGLAKELAQIVLD